MVSDLDLGGGTQEKEPFGEDGLGGDGSGGAGVEVELGAIGFGALWGVVCGDIVGLEVDD